MCGTNGDLPWPTGTIIVSVEFGPGSRLDEFEIVRCLGVGGMGEVWLARDRNLHRLVAIKLLPSGVIAEPGRIERLRREALTASALNHPNVCTIYALGTAAEGRLFVAMEYIEGGPLRDRLAGPVPIGEAIDIGAQIAAGLARAHASGVIHRDIKPENIMIRPDGLVKVLDFGLARLDSKSTSFGASTLTAIDSQVGAAGTLRYMSPEQARGEPLDGRTDVFSLGAVLYEMVTGRPPFEGTTSAVVYDGILNRAPKPALTLNPGISPQLESVIQKALEKNRDLRHQSASELRADLLRMKRDAEISSVPAHGNRGRRGFMPWFALIVALVVVVVLGGRGLIRWNELRHGTVATKLQEVQITSNSSENPVVAATVSPDARHVVYADRAGIHVRGIDTGEVHTLTAPEIGDVNNVRFFPNGMKLVVSATERGGKTPSIWSVSLVGGPPRRIRTGGLEASVAPDGSQIAFVDAERRNIWVMGPNGEQPHTVVQGAAGDTYYFPGWAPEGLGYGRRRATIDETGTVKTEVSAELLPPQGNPTLVLAEPGLTTGTRLPDGRLLYSIVAEPTLGRAAGLWELIWDRQNLRPITPARRLRQWPDDVVIWDMTSSVDGSRVTFLKQVLQKDVYIADLGQDGMLHHPRRLTLDDGNDFATLWTPDSSALFFTSDRNGTLDVFRQRLDSTLAEAVISGPADESGPSAVSPDGRSLYYTIAPESWRSAPQAGNRLMRTPESGGPREQLADESGAHVVLCARSPSKGCVWAERVGAELAIYSFDSHGGKGRLVTRTTQGSQRGPHSPIAQVASVSAGLHADMSPDGSQVAVLLPAERQIRVLSLAGDKDDVIDVDRLLDDAPIHWSFDAKGWYVSSTPPTYPAGTELLHVDRKGRTRVIWQQNVRAWTSVIASPNGRHIAITHTSAVTNVWMLTGF
jgi:serine/threonine protein kinase/Tol biopolymer transport system component